LFTIKQLYQPKLRIVSPGAYKFSIQSNSIMLASQAAHFSQLVVLVDQGVIHVFIPAAQTPRSAPC